MPEPIEIVVGIIALAIIIPVGGYAINMIWGVSDQFVQNSGSAQLQASYGVGKAGINAASDVEDSFAFAKSILALAAIIGIPAAGIKAIINS